MDEFKIILQAPDYKMNKDGEVRRVINDKPLLILGGGKVLLKKPDGTMQHFVIDDLVRELFGNEDTKGQLRSQVVDFVSNNKVVVQSETNPTGDFTVPIIYVKPTAEEQKELEKGTSQGKEASPIKDEKPKTKSKIEKVKKSIQKKVGVIADKISGPVTKEAITKEIERIASLDCSESMKIWKLHQVGCSNEEILFYLNLPKEKSKKCLNTIWNYKHNESMRKKADLK